MLGKPGMARRTWQSGENRMRPTASVPRRGHKHARVQAITRPRVEALEERCLLSVGFEEFPVPFPESTPTGITRGPDGNLWFTNSFPGQIGRILTNGQTTLFALPNGGGPDGITGGPDGSIWFTEKDAGRIGRITPAGVITEFTISALGSRPDAITAGPDGNLWFTDAGTGMIGRITLTGVITEFALPNPQPGVFAIVPTGITAGPDGNLWFAENEINTQIVTIQSFPTEPQFAPQPFFVASHVGRITPTGAVTEFSVMTGVEGIAAGPDGNLWFTEFEADQIGRISTTGSVSEFALPTANSRPWQITAGSDGAMWFTENFASRLGRITTSGNLVEYRIQGLAPTGDSIAAGPNGNIWFAIHDGHVIDPSGHIGEAILERYRVTGPGEGGAPLIKAFDVTTGATGSFIAYDPRFLGGVRVAVGDVTGDGVPDFITGPGPGGGPDIRVFDGRTGALAREFYAFDSHYLGGVFVAVGNFDGDGHADIVVAADAGGGPEVKVFSGADGHVMADFMAYDDRFRGGVRVAVGDVNGDGTPDLITGAGFSGGPHVKVFSGKDFSLLESYYAYDPRFTGGIYVAAGDVNHDLRADVITGAGLGGSPHVNVFSGADGTVLRSFLAGDASFLGGVRVAAFDQNRDGTEDIVTASGPSGGPRVKVLDGANLALLDSFFAYDPAFHGGLFVGAG
jgi:streptogramin lyase